MEMFGYVSFIFEELGGGGVGRLWDSTGEIQPKLCGYKIQNVQCFPVQFTCKVFNVLKLNKDKILNICKFN